MSISSSWLIRLNNEFLFPDQSFQLMIFRMDDQEFLAKFELCSFMFPFITFIIRVNQFVYRFIVFLHLISSFSLTISLLGPHAYVSIKSIDYILLSSFELKAILLISSVKTLHLSLLNLCCVFNIDLLFLMNSLWPF